MNRPRNMFALMCAAVLGCAILPASAQQTAPSEPPTLPTLPERQPPTVLSASTQGEIRFDTRTPFDFDVLLTQLEKAPLNSGKGTLFLPTTASAANPVAALVLLPGSGGISPGREMEYGRKFADQGYAAIVVDYYSARGYTPDAPYRDKTSGVTEFDIVADAYGALRALAAHPAIDARRVGGNEEDRDRAVAPVGGGDPGEDDEEVGDGGVGDELLRAVDHEVLAVGTRARAQARGVGARTRLGEGEGGHDVPGGDPREPPLLLPGGPESHQNLAGDAVVGAEHRAERQAGVPQLHRELDVLDEVEPEPSPLVRDREAEQTHVRGLLAQVLGDGVCRHDLGLARDHAGADEVADLTEDLGEDVVGDRWVSGVHV